MEELVLSVDGALRDLLTTRHRAQAVRGPLLVPADPTSTLGHIVQSVGVPLTEVGTLLLDDARPRHRPRPPGRLAVLPVARPQPLPTQPGRFLLDVHLGSLARLLRVLGLDVAYEREAGDDTLMARANEEGGQLLLTQDRGLLRQRALHHGAFVRGAGAAAQLDDVLDRFAPDLAPWTRGACTGAVPTRHGSAPWSRTHSGSWRRVRPPAPDLARVPSTSRGVDAA